MAVSKRLRFAVLNRDKHTCQYCGRSAPEVVLEVDHVIPVALGGRDEPQNLRTACRDCNSGKTSTSSEEVVPPVPYARERMAAAFQEAQQALRRDPRRAEPLIQEVTDEWYDQLGTRGRYVTDAYTWGDKEWAVITDHDEQGEASRGIPFKTEEEAQSWLDERVDTETPPLPDDLDESCRRWWDAGVQYMDNVDRYDFVARSVDIASRRRSTVPDHALFSYFAGVMWNRLREIQNRAEQTLREGE